MVLGEGCKGRAIKDAPAPFFWGVALTFFLPGHDLDMNQAWVYLIKEDGSRRNLNGKWLDKEIFYY